MIKRKINKNIYIFNMLDNPNCIKKLPLDLYDTYYDDEITSEKILQFWDFELTPSKEENLRIFTKINNDYLSIHSLQVQFSKVVIERLIENGFNTIEDLANDFANGLKINYLFGDKKLISLRNFVIEYFKLNNKDIDNLQESTNHEENVLKTKKLYTFDLFINEFSGQMPYIDLFEKYIVDERTMNDLAYLESATSTTIGNRLQKFINIIKNSNIYFENEEKFTPIFNEYKISQQHMSIIDLDDSKLYRYLKLKTNTKPKKEILDYLNERGTKSQWEEYARITNKYFIDGKIFGKVGEVFTYFIVKKDLKYFNLVEIYPEFYSFCSDNNIQLEVKQIDSFVCSDNNRTFLGYIEREENIFNLGSHNYVYFNHNDLSDDFLNILELFLKSIDAIMNIEKFFNIYKKECNENNIESAELLFQIAKLKFADKLKHDVDFVRVPTITKKNFDARSFYTQKIKELSPIKINDFKEYLEEEFCIGRDSYFNNALEYIKPFIKGDEIFYSDEMLEFMELDIKRYQTEIDKILSFLEQNNGFVSREKFNQFIIENINPEASNIILSNNNCKQINIRITNNLVYKTDQYLNIKDLLTTYFTEKKVLTFSDSDLNEVFNIDYLYNTFYFQKTNFDFKPYLLKSLIHNNKHFNMYSFDIDFEKLYVIGIKVQEHLENTNLVYVNYDEVCNDFHKFLSPDEISCIQKLENIEDYLFFRYLIYVTSCLSRISNALVTKEDYKSKICVISSKYKNMNNFYSFVKFCIENCDKNSDHNGVNVKEVENYILSEFKTKIDVKKILNHFSEKQEFKIENDFIHKI
ncbi:hypothetical protein H9M94_00470 [Mycoplasma sp. Pen4]|uniref:hypothetical protein n=1 Tax=Mycoplasma sp. Pen4 TaxID=640330 RepID=UPI0016548C8A|nr:hypothetical protein [Mycoplasma sp. Pen4]QNM93738.1 hypothetical protein H9M94_00470 [Mycoplasma sp. Pen4]